MEQNQLKYQFNSSLQCSKGFHKSSRRLLLNLMCLSSPLCEVHFKSHTVLRPFKMSLVKGLCSDMFEVVVLGV
jgi:hypothetical protein